LKDIKLLPQRGKVNFFFNNFFDKVP